MATKKEKSKKNVVRTAPPYSKSAGTSPSPSKKLTREEYEDRTLPLLRCAVTHERTRKLREVLIRVRVPDSRLPGKEVWSVSTVRVKPEIAAMFDKHTVDAKVDVVAFPISTIAQREHLSTAPMRFHAIITRVFDLVDYTVHQWLPGKSPFKKMSQEEVDALEDPVLREQLAENEGVEKEKEALSTADVADLVKTEKKTVKVQKETP